MIMYKAGPHGIMLSKKEKVVCEVKYLYSDNFSLRFKYAIQYCTGKVSMDIKII